jgi:hypothetical protein
MMGERALRVCQHPDPQKPEIRGCPKYHFVPKERSMAFYERVLYDAMRLFHRFSHNTRNENPGDIIVVRRKNN